MDDLGLHVAPFHPTEWYPFDDWTLQDWALYHLSDSLQFHIHSYQQLALFAAHALPLIDKYNSDDLTLTVPVTTIDALRHFGTG